MNKQTVIYTFALLLSLSLVLAVDFNSTILDSNKAYLNPSIVIDQSNGVSHMFWSNGQDLIYTTSLDTSKKIILYSGVQQVGNIQTVMDSNKVIHLVFSTYNQTYKYFYMNSLNWKPIDLNINYYENTPSIAINPLDNSIYIALVDGKTGVGGSPTEDNIVIASSSDYTNFNYQYLNKPDYQMNPVIRFDRTGILHLIFWDWKDGIGTNKNGEGVGLYKTRYSSSLDNFQSEQNVSTADRSYGADMQVDSNNNIWVIFKDSTEDYVGEEFGSGVIWLADKDSNWAKQKVSGLKSFMQDRPLSLSISSDNTKHFVWSEMNYTPNIGYGDKVYIMYGKSDLSISTQLQDVGFNPALGYVHIATDNRNQPLVLANVHSIAFYQETIPEIDLQRLINELQFNLTQMQNKIDSLETRVSFLEQVVNAIKLFFIDFWSYFESPDKCINNQLRCSGNNTQICTNYKWTNKDNCSNGCTNGKCNKEDCTKLPIIHSCQWGYSTSSKYYCPYKQGTNTQCNAGQCKINWDGWTYCKNKCNVTTGLCN